MEDYTVLLRSTFPFVAAVQLEESKAWQLIDYKTNEDEYKE